MSTTLFPGICCTTICKISMKWKESLQEGHWLQQIICSKWFIGELNSHCWKPLKLGVQAIELQMDSDI